MKTLSTIEDIQPDHRSRFDPRFQFPKTCHPVTIAIYEYWLRKCGDRRMPARSDIDPTEMAPNWLPGICIVEAVRDERRYVYRLVGTGEVEVRGQDPTGKSVIQAFFGPNAEDVLLCYDRVADSRAPLLDDTPFKTHTGRHVTEETIFLPLSEDGTRVSKILVFSYSRGLTS
jgi:hypothetical protein